MMYRFHVGLDLGQLQDYTAVSILDQRLETQRPDVDEMFNGVVSISVPRYELRYLERFPLNTPYPEVVQKVKALMMKPEVFSNAILVVDKTGVGQPVVDDLRREGLPLVGVQITGGSTVTQVGKDFRVPKADLISAFQVLVQGERLKIASSLEHAQTLKQEILNFRVKTNERTGNESFEAWREGDHDDLVLATALACWYATRNEHRSRVYADDYGYAQVDEEYDPLRWEM